MVNEINLKEWKEKYENGDFDINNVHAQIEAGWFDWFCKDTSLLGKTRKLAPKVIQVMESSKINKEDSYVFFKNNCPMVGKLYDSFSICDIHTGDVLYWVCPSSGFDHKKGVAEVWGKDNGFKEALVEGTWRDVMKFFKEGK